MYKVLRKTTCSRKSVEIHCDTAIFIEIYEEPLTSRNYSNSIKRECSFDTILAFVKGVSFVGDKGYNEVRKSVIRSMLKFVNSEGKLFA